MTINPDDLLNSILASLGRVDYVKPDDLPNVQLYMDQVLNFMEVQLDKSRRYPEDKILTKTMINNYTKNELIPPPDKKRYSREHMLLLIFIYYFKSFLSINDIDKLLTPLTTQYFDKGKKNSGLDLTDIYKSVFSLSKDEVRIIAKDVARKFNIAQETFENVEGDEGERLRYFTFICMLSFEVYIKKTMIEKLIDLMPEPAGTKKK